MKKSLEDKVKQLVEKSTKLSQEHSAEDIDNALQAIGIKPFGDHPGVCQPPLIWNPILSRCVERIG